MPPFGPKHDKIWAWWASDIPLENMLKRVWCVDVLRWNLEIEPFVVQWIVQMEEDTYGLGVVEDHMPLWSVARKEMCYC
jgi:hypothetical protein